MTAGVTRVIRARRAAGTRISRRLIPAIMEAVGSPGRNIRPRIRHRPAIRRHLEITRSIQERRWGDRAAPHTKSFTNQSAAVADWLVFIEDAG